MGDPLSVTASIIAVVTITAQVGGLIDDFVSSYRDSSTALKEIAAELSVLKVVLERLHDAYDNVHKSSTKNQTPNRSRLPIKTDKKHSKTKLESAPTDAALTSVLGGLQNSMRKLDDVLKKSNERMIKGGFHKMQVQMLWQRTYKGIDKIRVSLTGYKITLMLLLEAKILETTATPDTIRAAVNAAIDKSADYQKDINAGERSIDEVRKYLDEIDHIPPVEPGSRASPSDTAQKFAGFEDWLASFSASTDEEQKDDALLRLLRKTEVTGVTPSSTVKTTPSGDAGLLQARQPSKILLIVTSLQKPHSSSMFVEQLHVEGNTEITEVLGMLKDKGYSVVTGFQTNGPRKTGMMGPIYSLDGPVPVRLTSGTSCYDVSQGLRINEDETLLAFYNRYIMNRRQNQPGLLIRHKLDGIYATDTLMKEDCLVRLSRTVRVPEDRKVHELPATFGPLPLINLSKCDEARIPSAMRSKGGFVTPMLQREAMCISLSSEQYSDRWQNIYKEPTCLFAMRVYAGGVNVLSGQLSTENNTEDQDYYVLPLQKRIDGFRTADSAKVKQFVSMPLGTGYSVEAQLTGKELGGIQFQIAPQWQTNVEFQQIGVSDPTKSTSLPLTRTPRHSNLRADQTIRMIEERNFGMAAPWEWDSSKDQTSQLEEWTGWTEYKHSDTRRRELCDYCEPGARYPKMARPAYISDLVDDADMEMQGALVVSALPLISVTVVHLHKAEDSYRKTGELHELFRKTLEVSPFENAAVLKGRIGHILETWYEKHPMQRGRTWKIRKTHSALANARAEAYEGLFSIGITDGATIETVEKVAVYGGPAPQPSRRPKGWEMALAAGGNLKQIAKQDPIPGCWNWEASEFVNIQILNTVAFESVTGLAPPPGPISMMEYTKAEIPSLSYYYDEDASAVTDGKFPDFQTVGDIDLMVGIKYAVRLDTDGKPVGCVVCERSLCDALIEPCGHAFCYACIRCRMQKGGGVTCILCSKRGEKVILSAAAMEIPIKKAVPPQSQAPPHAGHEKLGDGVPADIQTQLPSLSKLFTLDERISEKIYMRLAKDPNQEYMQAAFSLRDTLIDEALCRLVIAQILKDINYPRNPLPEYVKAAVDSVMQDVIVCAGYDTIQLLLSLGPDIDKIDYRGKSLLETICDRWHYSEKAPERKRREDVAKLLIDEGCDWSVLGKQEEKEPGFVWQRQRDDALRQSLQGYAQQKKNFAVDVVVEAK